MCAAGDGSADGELAAHPAAAQRAEIGEEGFGAAGAVGADQDRVPVPIPVRDLGQRLVKDGDVVGGGVRSGVAWAQLGGENSPVLSRNARSGW